MTSKSSFWVRLKENNKRRIWVWIISILAQLAVYPGVLTIYLSRIRYWNKDGAYATAQLYKKALCDAVTDAIGFQQINVVVIMGLAVIIAIQGFSYLYDKRKIDMYYSVPVSAKSRFAVVYINGIFAYILPYLCGMLIAIVMASAQGLMTSRAMAECGLSLLMNLLYFMAVYNTTVLAVMLTGHMIITAIATGVLLFISYIWIFIYSELRFDFFKRASDYFSDIDKETTFSLVLNYLVQVGALKRARDLSYIAQTVMPLCGKWLVYALIAGVLSYICYIRRPSESAGKAITFKVIMPFLKIIISATVGLIAFTLLYDSTYHNIPVSAAGMAAAAVLCAGIMEIIYEFELRAALKHLVTTGISAVIAIAIFSIFNFDIFSYDTYVPEAENVESIALCLQPYDGYYYYEFTDDNIKSINAGTYLRENMFITDVEPVLELAQKGLNLDMEGELTDGREVCVLYRLKSGREVSRSICVDFEDESNMSLLDRIIEADGYKEAVYQTIKSDELFRRKDLQLSYENGIVESSIPTQEALKLREAWVKDMENFNFSLARNNRLCGCITTFMGVSYMRDRLPVYENFTNTIECLKENNAYYPSELKAEDILSLSVTNYHYEDESNSGEDIIVYDSYTGSSRYGGRSSAAEVRVVTEEFTEPEEIEAIIKGLYPVSMSTAWNNPQDLDRNYSVTISFKSGTGVPYEKGYNDYYFISGRIPEFVVERTEN